MANENKPRNDEERPAAGQATGQKPGQEMKPGQDKKPEADKKSNDRNKPTGQTKR